MPRQVPALLVALLVVSSPVRGQPSADAAAESVGAILATLHDRPDAQFRSQEGWTIVASRERGEAVEWFFTPEGHPAHPAVVKRVAVERDGVGMIDLTATCHAPQADCDRLVDDFRQRQLLAREAMRVEPVMLDVGIAVGDRERVALKRLPAESGKAAEIRMDDVFKMIIVPTLEERGVVLWTALYEFDGRDYALLAAPQLSGPIDGTATVDITAASGGRFGVSVTPILERSE